MKSLFLCFVVILPRNVGPSFKNSTPVQFTSVFSVHTSLFSRPSGFAPVFPPPRGSAPDIAMPPKAGVDVSFPSEGFL